MVNHSFFQSHGLLLGRVLMGLLFLLAGISKFNGGLDGTASMIDGAGLPAAALLALIVALIEVIGGAALILGYKAKEAALVLAAFAILAAVLIHGNPGDPMLMKDLAIAGGLLYVVAHGIGNTWSIKK